MGSLEEIHEQIHINLSLLHANGHNIIFEQNMFRDRNQPGFERVGYYLLMLLDPNECKKSIPWPILEARTRLQFQRGFIKFIKDINKKYNEANIPEVAASSLQAPGGYNFLFFMYRLSSFALQLDLIRMSRLQERDELLPRPLPSKKPKVLKVHTAIVIGARCQAEKALQETVDYVTQARPVLKNLNRIDDILVKKRKELDAKLEAEVYSLDVDDQIKQRMLNIEDSEVMKDYNTRTQNKMSELRSASEKLSKYSALASKATRLLRTTTEMHTQPLCLDGSQLNIAPAIAQLAGSSVYNEHREVRLDALLRAGLAGARRLSPVDHQQTQLLVEVKTLQEETNLLRWRGQEANTTLETLRATNQKIIDRLQPVVYDQVKEKKRPEFFKYLRELPPLQFVLPSSFTNKSTPKQERPRRLQGLLKRGHTVVSSTKQTRSHLSAFRKPLPSSLTSRTKRTIHFPDNRSLIDPHTPLVNHSSKTRRNPFLSGGTQAAGNAPSTSKSEDTPLDVGSTPQTTGRRSSINELITRFRRVKNGMREDLL